MTANPSTLASLPDIAEDITWKLCDAGFDPATAVQRQVLNLAEEVGEFVGAYRRYTGQARRTGTAEEMHDELADVVLTAFVTAAEMKIDLEAVIAAKLAKVYSRGWRDTRPS